MFSAIKLFAHARHSCFAVISFDITRSFLRKNGNCFARILKIFLVVFLVLKKPLLRKKEMISFPGQRKVALEFTEDRGEMT